MKRVLVSAFLVAFLLSPAPAGPAGEIMTRYDLESGIGETVLENGLRVLTLERGNAPVVSCQIWYRVGSANELPGETGLAHFLEHLMFKGTDRYAKGEIDRITLKLGGMNNAATFKDWTYYFFNLASDRWETALEIEANRMRNLLFDPEEFEAERKVVIEELQIGRDGPWSELDETAEAVAFSAHPYRHPVIGWKSDLESVTRERVKAFYDLWYHPRHATLVLVGDFDTKRALTRIHELFGDRPAGPEPSRTRSEEPRQNGERRLRVLRDAELTRMEILYHSLPAGHPDDAVLDVIRVALVNGKSSRLGRRLLEEERLLTFVEAANDSRRDPGIFWIYTELREDADAAQVEAAIHEETARLGREGLTPDELERARKTLLVDQAFARATAERTAEEIGYWASVADWRLVGTADDRIRAVTDADVRRIATDLFRPDNRTVAIAVPDGDEPAGGGAHSAGPAKRSARAEPAGGPRVRLAPKVVHLPNGLTLLLARVSTVPVVAMDVFVDAGRTREAAPGLAQFTGNALLEGAAGLTAVELDEEISRLGAEVRATGTGLAARALAEDAERLVPLVAALMRRPEFPPSGIEKVRERTRSEIRAEEDDPQRVAKSAFDAAVYGEHPLGRPARGTIESVDALTREEIVAHHARWFVPGNTVISVVSSRPPEEIEAMLAGAFGDWAGEAPPAPTLPPIPAPAASRREILRETDQANVYLGHRGIARDDPDYYPLLVMDYVLGLGPGFTDRLSKTIRDRDGLAYNVYASITRSADREPGTFAAFVGTSAKQRDRAIEGILAEVRRIREEPVDGEELADAKAYLTGSFVFGYETAEQLAVRFTDIHRLRLGFDYPAEFARKVEAVTADDVLRVARAHLDPDAMTIVSVGPK